MAEAGAAGAAGGAGGAAGFMKGQAEGDPVARGIGITQAPSMAGWAAAAFGAAPSHTGQAPFAQPLHESQSLQSLHALQEPEAQSAQPAPDPALPHAAPSAAGRSLQALHAAPSFQAAPSGQAPGPPRWQEGPPDAHAAQPSAPSVRIRPVRAAAGIARLPAK